MIKLEDFKIGEIKKMVSKYNKQVKIGPISKLNKADLIKHIREHPKLTVTENEKGVRISVKGEVNIGDKKIKIKKEEKSEYIKKYEAAKATPLKTYDIKPETAKKIPAKKAEQAKKIEAKKKEPLKAKIINAETAKKPLTVTKASGKVIELKKRIPKKETPKIDSSKEVVKGGKPKIPSITITEEEKPKRKVIKKGGRFITVKEKKDIAKQPEEPEVTEAPKTKPKKIRLPKEEKEEKKEEEKKEEPKKEESSEDEEEEEQITLRTFKPISVIPKALKKVWFEYMDLRAGSYTKEDQNDEVEELERVENNFIKANSNRKNKNLSSSEQMKGVFTIGQIIPEVIKEINDNPDLIKLYKVFQPSIIKNVLDQRKKTAENAKKEEAALKKQEKADKKAHEKSLKD